MHRGGGRYLAPSFVSGLWFLPQNGIRLGLDLQGGSHLVLEVEVEKAVENRMRRIRSALRDELRERGIAFTGLDINDAGELVIAASSDNMERIRDLLSAEFQVLEVAASGAGAGGPSCARPSPAANSTTSATSRWIRPSRPSATASTSSG